MQLPCFLIYITPPGKKTPVGKWALTIAVLLGSAWNVAPLDTCQPAPDRLRLV